MVDKPFYSPGDEVISKIYMRVTTPFTATKFKIKVQGKEKMSLLPPYSFENGKPIEVKKVKVLNSKMRREDMCRSYEIGDYLLEFNFTLPYQIPSSFMFTHEWSDDREFVISYYTSVKIKDSQGVRVFSYKRPFIIRDSRV